MSANEQRRARAWPLPVRVVLLQFGVVLMAAIGAAAVDRGVAVLLGGACASLPNAWMALRASLAGAPGEEVRSAIFLALAMLGKLALTVVLLALVWWWAPQIDAVGFFSGFILALLAHHASLLLDE